ncbi:hypothetical protein EB796_019335 [Bugula neritina]|uniref:Uncharacterized protein n=1 Tax=Bugula neritina TaxID=10212 RepID=A0A7J7J8P6_BUGNE|nr:hypothetical protein EB796_019335 [Bugula neritina]
MCKSVLVFVCCVALASGHLCLVNPHQRGSIEGLNKPAAKNCFLRTAPCGGRPTEPPQLKIKQNDNYTVIFQQNVNHLNPLNPGHFSISWASYADDGLTHQQVALIPDTGLPPLHLYVQTVPTPPALNNPTKVLQVSYVTNKPGFGPYYQCADVEVY